MPSSNLLLASKIIVTEEPPQIRNIPGVPTAIAAFLGITERGPIGFPVFITSFEGYVNTFGGYLANSDLPLAVEAFFVNGGTAAWITSTCHYTDILDPNTATATKGQMTIVDRGGVAGPAVLDSSAGPWTLEPGDVVEVNIDGAGADTLNLTASPAEDETGNSAPFALVNGDTFIYQTNASIGSAALGIQRTITFLTGDFVSIGAATAAEVANVINRDGVGISAEVTSTTKVTIRSDAKGTGAKLVIDAGSTSIAGGKLNLPAQTNVGSGNVALIGAVTATELAGLLTALPLSSGTATVYDTNKLRLTSTGTGVAVTIVVTANTTADGVFIGSLPITQPGTDAAESNTLTIIGKTPRTWVQAYSVAITTATSGDSDRFDLRFLKGGAVVEAWPNLSMDENDARYVEDFIVANSNLFDAVDESSPAVSPNNMPKIGTYSVWTGDDDGLSGLADSDFVGSEGGGTGLYAFDQVSQITILAIPGRSTSAVHNAMITYCETHRTGTCFAVLDPPAGLDAQGIKTYVETTAALYNLSEFAAIYWPRVKILNPSEAVFGTTEDNMLVVPPSGHIVGVYARTDADRPGGVYDPPAGTEKGILSGVLGFETDEVLDERKRDVVFPSRINPLTAIDGSPRHIDGARSLKGDGNFPSVSERRGVIYIEQSLKRGLLFAKHRNNDRRLRMEVKRSILVFLLLQYNLEAFRGDTPSESFFVDVSDEVNPPEVIFAGQLVVRIGLATQKPLEFMILKFTQDTRALEERLASQGLG